MSKFVLSLFCLVFFTSTLLSQVEGKLLSVWSDSTLVGSTIHNNTYNEIWGLYVNDHEIAVIGSTAGTHFIDVTDPINPIEIHFVKGAVSSPAIIHRDYHDHNGYLYAVADEGQQSTLQIIDISQLPNEVQVVYDSKEFIRRSHNIFIDQTHDRMYACITTGDSVNYVPLRIFDISNPANITVLGDGYSFIDGFSISQVHDIYVKDHLAYLNCGPSGLAIVDFTDVQTPVLKASLTVNDYQQSGYNHSGWLSDDGNTYFFADETFNKDVKAVDVSNLPELEMLSLFNAESTADITIPHNLIAHDEYLYVSYYYDGLQVFDIKDPLNIERVMYFNTSVIPARSAYEGAWGVYPLLPSGNILVSDMQNGLFVIEAFSPIASNNKNIISQAVWDIFPNPSIDRFTINLRFENKDQSTRMKIYDLKGQLVLEKNLDSTVNHHQIPHNLKTGNYLIELKIDNKTTSKILNVR